MEHEAWTRTADLQLRLMGDYGIGAEAYLSIFGVDSHRNQAVRVADILTERAFGGECRRCKLTAMPNGSARILLDGVFCEPCARMTTFEVVVMRVRCPECMELRLDDESVQAGQECAACAMDRIEKAEVGRKVADAIKEGMVTHTVLVDDAGVAQNPPWQNTAY